MIENLSLKEKQEYEKIIVRAIAAARDLEKRHRVENLIGILQNESLREWPRIARRV